MQFHEDKAAGGGSEEAMKLCDQLEAELAELRAAYEQHFLGNERLAPLKKHEAFKKQYDKLKGSMVRQTAAKFRIESIGQKLLTYARLWERTLKEIEAGTYKREIARLKRRPSGIIKQPQQLAQPPRTQSDEADFDVDEELDLFDSEDDISAALDAALGPSSVSAVTASPVVAPAVAPVPRPAAAVNPPPVAPLEAARPKPAGQGPFVPPVAPLRPQASPPASQAVPTIRPPLPTAGFAAALPPHPQQSLSQPQRVPQVAAPPRVAQSPQQAPRAGTPPPRASPAASAPGGSDGLSDAKIKAIYEAYVMAKKRCGEDTRSVTLDAVASSLKKQVPELMKQHNAKSVEFKVVIKDGKAVLRAQPKTD